MDDLRTPGKRDITLGVIGPNAATHRKYRDALQKAVANMSASYLYWIRGKYAAALEANAEAGNVPDIAQDAKPGATPARAAARMLAELTRLRERIVQMMRTAPPEQRALAAGQLEAIDVERDRRLSAPSK